MVPRRPLICLVTAGRVRRPGDEEARAVVALASQASAAGVSLVQVRERDLDDRALLEVARAVGAAVDRGQTRVVVNDRADVAMAAGADGVHLRASAPPASRVRAIAPERFLIGRSVHSVEEARAAAADGGADYLLFGTVFRSESKAAGHPVAGVAALAEVCAAVPLPVVAIGGVDGARAREAAAAGAAGVAAIGLFAESGRGGAVEAAVRGLREAFDTR